MTRDADTLVELEFERLRLRQRSRAERAGHMTPAVKMLIGDWYVDELGILTREIKARDQRERMTGRP
jgi:hypothetical protein